MSIDYTHFLGAARRVIRDSTGDLTRGMPANERSEYVDEEALSLAYALAEISEERCEDLRSSLRAEA